MTPEFIISTNSQPNPTVTPFRELYAQIDAITHMTLLWDTNSYHVNIKERYFVINGGRKLFFKDFPEKARVFYAARNRMSVDIDSNKVKERDVTYLLGLESGETQVLIHITGDGKLFAWKNKR